MTSLPEPTGDALPPPRRPAAAPGGRLLRWAGVNRRQFRALLNAYLLIDFRSQQFGRATATGPRALITPLFWVVGQCLLLGGIASVVMMGRVDADFFALVALGTSMTVMATTIIVEFNEVVLDPADLEAVGHYPVSVRTYAAARVANLLGYVLLMTLALNVFPAVAGVGLRDASWTFLPAYAFSAVTGNLAVAGAIVLLYTAVLGGRPGEAAREVLAWAQIVLVVVFFYGGQVIFRDSRYGIQMAAYDLPSWVRFLPPAWLADFVDSVGPGSSPQWWVPAASAVVVAGLWGAVLWRLSIVYAAMHPGRAAWGRDSAHPMRRPGSLGGLLGRRLTHSPQELAAYWLCSTQLSRDHDLRMRGLPALGIVLVPLLVGLFTDQLADPLARPGPACALSLACVYLLATPVAMLMNNLHFSRDHAAGWLLLTSPIGDADAFAEGLRKALTIRVLLPALAVLLAVFAATWREPVSVAVHVLTGWLVITAAGHASKIGLFRGMPFSAPLARGETMGAVTVFAGALGGISLLLGVVHYNLLARWDWLAAYLAGLVALMLLLRWHAAGVLRRRFAARGAA